VNKSKLHPLLFEEYSFIGEGIRPKDAWNKRAMVTNDNYEHVRDDRVS